MKNSLLKMVLFTIILLVSLGGLNVKAENLPVVVNGTQLSDEVTTMTFGEGILKYDKVKKELILENVTITSDDNYAINLISTTDEVKIILKGDNKIIVTGENFGVRSSANLIITGDGKLTIVADFPAIQGKNITIDGANLDLTTTGENLASIENDNNLIIKNNSKIKAKGYGSAISSFAKLEIKDSKLELEATGERSNAIYVEPTNGDGSLNIENSKIKAKSGYASVYSAGKMTLNKSKFELDSIAGGIYSDTSVEINNSKVCILSGNYGIGVGQGLIDVDNSTFEISVNRVSFTSEPNITGLDNKIVYVGHETDGSDATILDMNNDFNISEYNYVKIISKYIIKIVADENVLLDTEKEIYVIEGENKDIVIKAKDGYKIKEVLVNNNELSLSNNTLSLSNIKEDIMIKITSEKSIQPQPGVNNPETGDNILFYMITGILSMVGLISISLFMYKKTTN